MYRCRLNEEDVQQYSLYVHGHFIPWVDKLRQNGEIREATFKLKDNVDTLSKTSTN